MSSSYITRKIITVSIDIDDPITVASDIDANLLKIAKQTYEGICWSGILITNVVEIVMKNDLICAQECDPDISTISLMLMVEGVSYKSGDIIPNCEVIAQNDVAKQILCKHKYITALTKLDQRFAAVDAKGMFISIVLRNVQYCPGASGISGEAVPFRPTKRYYIYKVTELTPATSNDTTAMLIDSLKNLNLGTLKANSRVINALTAYPMNELIDGKGSIGALKIVKMDNLLDGSITPPYYVAKHSLLSPIEDTVAVYQTTADTDPMQTGTINALFENGVLSVSDNPYEAILHSYVNYLEFAIDLAEMFTDSGLAKSHGKILDIYDTYKENTGAGVKSLPNTKGTKSAKK